MRVAPHNCFTGGGDFGDGVLNTFEVREMSLLSLFSLVLVFLSLFLLFVERGVKPCLMLDWFRDMARRTTQHNTLADCTFETTDSGAFYTVRTPEKIAWVERDESAK